ncbi:hypothetical protein GCM10027277_57940 [Pseudoduganella ginsengisoli]|uniref:Toxin co-regulated pilus biosynthesis protein Q C-terminal domain-containing protein n=1 Tax=Pseudoduganella ginsengisoli TaxID=1462440 RepID=A0A6L6Q9M3_9BURK|nr:TrbG/VirB9 family P-type conjugative transfer protein [Pseudoduganella ginsengisoli]MTW05898.1 hypothetical protein [Pseudoduganella ginsengisoli]
MKAIIASFLLAIPTVSWAAEPADIESVTIPYATKMVVSCGSLQVCDLEFQPGETIRDFQLTDKQNWSINPATTGENEKKVQHLIVMPVTADLKSPLTIITDRRQYEVMLESNNNILASRKIAFSYQTISDKITDISKNTSFVQETPAELALPSDSVAQTQTKNEMPGAPTPQTWALKPEHHSLRDVIEDWATSAGETGSGYEVIWETRDFPLSIKQKKTISTGDFFDALRLLGEAYRNSDAPFQIQPTAFQQIVVQPMNKAQR